MAYRILEHVELCPRCGGEHFNLPVFEFKKRFVKIGDKVYTHWTYCPDFLEPITLELLDKHGFQAIETNHDEQKCSTCGNVIEDSICITCFREMTK